MDCELVVTIKLQPTPAQSFRGATEMEDQR